MHWNGKGEGKKFVPNKQSTIQRNTSKKNTEERNNIRILTFFLNTLTIIKSSILASIKEMIIRIIKPSIFLSRLQASFKPTIESKISVGNFSVGEIFIYYIIP